jgi:hypothetical protein
MLAHVEKRQWSKTAGAVIQLSVLCALLGSCTWFLPPDSGPGAQLTAVIKASPAHGTAPLDVTFDASSSSDPVGEGMACTWFFGDGSSASGERVTHTYGVGGTYQVLLIVEDNQGTSATASGTIEVSAQTAQVEDRTSETDAAGVATLTVGGEALSITVMLPGTSPGSASRQGSGGSAGLGVRVYALGETLGVFVYDDLQRYEPAIAVLEGGAPSTSGMATARATLTQVIELSLMQGRDGVSVVTSSKFTDAMETLGYNPYTRRYTFSFPTSEEGVQEALEFGMLRPALRLDSGAAPEGAGTPYALYIRPAIAAELGLGAGANGVAVTGYGLNFLTALGRLLTPIWQKAASVTFTVGLAGASGAPIPASAVLESYSGGTDLTVLVEAENELQRFQCNASGSVLGLVEWDFGDGCQGQGSAVEHVYNRCGDYDVAATVRDSYGRELHGNAVVTIPCACSAGRYALRKALEYAEAWWDTKHQGVNTAGGYKLHTVDGKPNGDPADCANFASQCLIAGGIDLTRQGTATSEKTITSSTTLNNYLKTCLEGVQTTTRGPAEGPPVWFGPGDVAIFHYLPDCTTEYNDVKPPAPMVKHTVFAVRRSADGVTECAAHSGDLYGWTIKQFFEWDQNQRPGKKGLWLHCTYYHIPGCLSYNCTSTPTPTLLDAPQLQAPSDAAPSQSVRPTLQWSQVAGASKYWVLLATDRSALPTDVNAVSCEGCLYKKEYTSSTQYEIKTPLTAGTTYYWCIQACDLSATHTRQGNYSEIRSFTTLAGDCTYSLTDYEEPFTNSGGSGSFRVETQTGCAWTATSDSTWLTFTASGSPGSGPVYYSVSAYSGTELRTGRITVRDNTFTVTQTGTSPCSYTLSSYVQDYTDSGSHSANFNVTAGSGCTWSPVVSTGASSWLTAVASVSAGNGRVDYTITANDTSVVRTGYIYVQDKTFTMTQAAKPPVAKELDHIVVNGPSMVNENTVTPYTCTAHFNDTTSLDVTALATWTEDSPYTTVSGGNLTVVSLSGDSSCAVRASYTYNGINKWAFKAVALKDVVTVLDRIEVTGPTVVNENSWGDFACTAYFSNGDIKVVTSSAVWTCSSSSSWVPLPASVTITNGRLSVGSLDSDADCGVTASYTYGSTTKYRGEAVHLHDTTPPIPTVPCVYEVGPTAPRVAGSGGSGVVCVRTAAGCLWTAVTSDSWIHITTGRDYSGNGDVGYTVDLNPGAERSGTITAAGKTCTIPQSQGPGLPPVARLTMSAQGKTAYESETLSLTVSSGQTIRVQLSAARSSVDTSAPNAYWSIDEGLGSFNSETYWDFSTAGTHLVRLFVTNSDGHTGASADAQVVITTAP